MLGELNKKEDLHTEFKLSFQEKAIETLVAFANTSGGTVYIGVNDRGDVEGVALGKETLQHWLNEIKQKTQPAIIPTITTHTVADKQYVTIDVQEFPVKPLSFKGRYYKQVNNANHQLTAKEITDLSLKSLQLSWDAYLKPKKSIADLEQSKINRFIEKVNASGRFTLTGNWSADFEKLKLISGDKITNAAWLLFGKEATEYNIHIGRFKTAAFIVDDKMVQDTLFEMVEQTMKLIINQLKVAFEITGRTTQRTEIFEYPLSALRELVLNAVVHRDYLSPIDTQIKIFDQSITIFSPGTLYGNLTVEALKKDNYQANTRNKLIAEMFYLTGDIEKYGSGFIRIRKAIKAYPTMKLSLEEAPNGFLVGLEYTQQKNKVGDKVGDKITDNQQLILNCIRKDNTISALKIAGQIGLSARKVEENISKLKAKGLLKRIGSARSGYWQIVD